MISFYNHYNELIHYGIPGMKWGKRKSGTSNQTSTPSKKTRIRSKANKPLQDNAKEWKKIGYSAAVGLMASKAVRNSISRKGLSVATIGQAAASASLAYFGAMSYYDLLTKKENS